MNDLQTRILEVLNDGRNSPKTADEIAIELRLPSERRNVTVRNAIKEMRRDFGKLIGSSNEGYFFIQDQEDLDVTIRHLNSRIRETSLIIERLQESFAGDN